MSAVTAGSEQLWDMNNELRYPRRVPWSSLGCRVGMDRSPHWNVVPRAEGPQDGSKGDGRVWVRFSCPRHCGAGLPGAAPGSGLIPGTIPRGCFPDPTLRGRIPLLILLLLLPGAALLLDGISLL